ncbi:MAG TPA: hypothetical protein VFO01_11440 [Trebonia sp.]|nr:hypothetical protein [Trebonia sp.]
MDMQDLTPAGSGSLRAPVTGPHGQTVAQFTIPPDHRPDELWEHGTRTTDATRGGSQGEPLGRYQPGHGLEHEPEDKPERESFDMVKTAGMVRAALRPGG